MRFPRAFRLLPLCLFLLTVAGFTVPAHSAEQCFTLGSTQFVDAIHYCVSSVLKPQGDSDYGPQNLADGDPATAWCEGVRGPGIGETITLRIDNGAPFRRLLIGNGYGKSPQRYEDNGRPHLVEIVTDRTPPTRMQLVDQNGILPVPLIDVGAYRWVRLKILSVYPGRKYTDTCMNFVTPDFEYEEELEWQRQLVAQAPTATEAPAAPAPALDAPELPQPSGPSPSERACVAQGGAVSGTLAKQRFEKSDGDSVLIFFVVPEAPACVSLDDGKRVEPIQRVQVVPQSLDNYLQLKNAQDGTAIRVSGRFEPTRLEWQIGDVLVVEPQVIKE